MTRPRLMRVARYGWSGDDPGPAIGVIVCAIGAVVLSRPSPEAGSLARWVVVTAGLVLEELHVQAVYRSRAARAALHGHVHRVNPWRHTRCAIRIGRAVRVQDPLGHQPLVGAAGDRERP